MKKEITITIVIIAILAIGLNITGFASNDPETFSVSVIRSPPIAGTGGTTYELTIVSSENVVAIKESFIPEDCEVILTLPIDGVDIFEFNENETTWIIADRAETFSFNMFYVIPLDCELNETAGEILTLTDDNQLASDLFAQQNEPASTPTGTSSGGSGGSSGGSGGTTSDLQSSSIQQASTEAEFNEIVENAVKNVLGLDESKQVDTSSLIVWLALAVIILIILIIFAYSFFKKPNQPITIK
jgi:hypothetical protein